MRPSHWLVLVSACLLTLTFTPSLPVALHAQSATELPAPMPTAAIQAMITQSDALEKDGKVAEALQTVERALQAAQAARDTIGEAQSQCSRARLLTFLWRIEEALGAWKATALAWERVGDGPGRLEALGKSGALSAAHSQEGQRLLSLALALGKVETKRPLAAAKSLNEIGVALFSVRRLEDATRFSEAALAIQNKLAPNSLEVATSLDDLGNVARLRHDLVKEQDYYQRSYMLRQKLAPNSLDMAMSLNNLALLAWDARNIARAEEYYQRSYMLRQKLAPNSLDMAMSLINLALLAAYKNDLAKAQDYGQHSLAIYERLSPNSLDMAAVLNNFGAVFQQCGELDKAEDLSQRSLALAEKIAPGSEDVAGSLVNLGNVAGTRGDLTKAEDFFKRSLALYEIVDPKSPGMTAILNNLGVIAFMRGDLVKAADLGQRSLALYKIVAPNSRDVANSLNNLGNVAMSYGDFDKAEAFYRRSIALHEKIAFNSRDVADSLNNLGEVAIHRGDLVAAEGYFNRNLDIQEKLPPDSRNPKGAFAGLGSVAYFRGDLMIAERYYQRSLEFEEKFARDSLEVALNLNRLGAVAYDRNDLAKAESYYQHSLALREKLTPNSQDVADSLNNLGNVAMSHGDFDKAEAFYRRSLTLAEKIAPNSLSLAESLNNLGEVLLRQKQPDKALHFLKTAAQIIEAQRGGLTTPEARSLFFVRYIHVFSLLRQSYLTLHQRENAFLALERQRARSFADHLAERRFHFDQDVNDAPHELLTKQQTLNNQRHIVLTERSRLDPYDPKDQPAYAGNDRRLQAIGAEQRQIEDQIRRASPRYAHLVYPIPPTFTQAQQALPPNTLLLEYAIDAKIDTDQVLLFALTRTSLQIYSLSVTPKDLEQEVNEFRKGIANPGSNTFQPALARRLYRQLLGVAATQIKASRRLLISPDGVLHSLPFAALMPAAGRFLIEEKPLHFVASLGVYRELQQQRTVAPRKWKHGLLALGDPLYPTTDLSSSPVTAVKPLASTPVSASVSSTTSVSSHASSATSLQQYITLGGRLERVCETGKQVRAIARFFPRTARVHVQQEATRSTVFREAGQARIVHFACHGLLDDDDPLASCLALTPEGKADDGLLRAYDVLTRLNLHADLVVLAACQTGLGGRKGVSESEGVVGLTRAFGYAGARSVLVSLWEIDEKSSTALMEAFYGQLRGGVSKDVALQEAQLALLRGKWKAGKGVSEPASGEWRRPYHWAAFMLTGDYQ